MSKGISNKTALIVVILLILGIVGFHFYQTQFSPRAQKNKELDSRLVRIMVDREMDGGNHQDSEKLYFRYAQLSDCTLVFKDCWIDSVEFPEKIELRRKLLKQKYAEYYNSGLLHEK